MIQNLKVLKTGPDRPVRLVEYSGIGMVSGPGNNKNHYWYEPAQNRKNRYKTEKTSWIGGFSGFDGSQKIGTFSIAF